LLRGASQILFMKNFRSRKTSFFIYK